MKKISDLNVILALYDILGVIAIEKLFSMGINPEQINIFTHKEDSRNLPLWNYAKSNCIKIVDYQVNSKDLYLWVKEKNHSVLFSLHYRDRISLKIIELTKYGVVNLHPSLLPDYRGCFSIPWVIINGEKRTGGIGVSQIYYKNIISREADKDYRQMKLYWGKLQNA